VSTGAEIRALSSVRQRSEQKISKFDTGEHVDDEVCRQRILIFLVRVTLVVFSSIAADKLFLSSAADCDSQGKRNC
jgi:hypothetical protein